MKEAVGSLMDDEDLKREGRADQLAGKVKDKADELIEKAKDVVTGKSGGDKSS